MSFRTKVAISAIAGIFAVVYVFSIVPYLFGSYEQSDSLPLIQIIMPALALPLIVVLVFLVPRRQVDCEPVPTKPARDVAEYRFRKRSLFSGALAGFISAWVLVGFIFGGDLVLGLPSGTFYSIIGISMAGLEGNSAVYFGVLLHLITGTLVGATFGYVTTVVEPFNISGVAKGAGTGVLAGFVTFSLLFIPLTRFEVEPSLVRILASIYPAGTETAVLEARAVDIMSAVLAGSILLHVLYGAVMGSITALLLSMRTKARLADANLHH